MKIIREIRHSQIIHDAIDADPAGFAERRAARAVIVDSQNRIPLLYVGKYAYHKLPGGGIEDDEDIAQALERELLEEVGCRAAVTGEVGEIIEYRDEWAQKQTSYCYVAKQFGPIVEPDFTDKELSEAFAVVWAKDIAEAIKLLEHDAPQHYGAMFIHERDLTFLRAAKELL